MEGTVPVLRDMTFYEEEICGKWDIQVMDMQLTGVASVFNSKEHYCLLVNLGGK